MARVTTVGLNFLDVCYPDNVDASLFSFADFESLPSSFGVIGIEQLGPSCMRLEFGDNVDVESELVYFGSLSGFVTPDQILIG